MVSGLDRVNAAWKDDPVEKTQTEILRRQMRRGAGLPIGGHDAAAPFQGQGDGSGESEAAHSIATFTKVLLARGDVDSVTQSPINGADGDRDVADGAAQRIAFRISSSTLLVRVSMDISSSSGDVLAWRVDPVVAVERLARHVADVDDGALDALLALCA